MTAPDQLHLDFNGTSHTAGSPSLAESDLPDAADRCAITHDLDTNLFVDAGAGSGKTTALVSRVINLVLRTGTPVTSIAAITFTEKAAAELRRRLRSELISAGLHGAAEQVDHAPIGTLHAFARRLLADFPIEVGLPPRFEVLDEVQSTSAFAHRFDDFIRELFDDADNVRLAQLCTFDSFGVPQGIRRMAEDFQSNWDLVDERVGAEVAQPVPIPVRELCDQLDALLRFDVPPDDSQFASRADFAQLRNDLLAASQDPEHIDLGIAIHVITTLAGRKTGKIGNKATWKKHTRDDEALERYRQALTDAILLASTVLVELGNERRVTLGALLRQFTLHAAEQRCADGRLEFHDLLVLARRLLRDHPDVRAALHQRYTHLFLDEFQDTDPIQLELAVRITASPAEQQDDWRKLRPLPGRLCVVGDPKQSIYRFRRADVAEFMRARVQLGATSATLNSNFRSTSAVIDWVNHTMAQVIVAADDVQPAYVALAARRREGRAHGSVMVLGEVEHESPDLTADDIRVAEANEVAGAIAQAIGQEWQVFDSALNDLRPCRLGDICILLPARTSLAALTRALELRGIPYRAENSSLVYAAPEIRALLLALRAIDDPTDELALVSSLRSSLFGCSDDDLYDWRVNRQRRWRFADPAPDRPVDASAASDVNHHADNHLEDLVDENLDDHPVRVAFRCLAELHAERHLLGPAELLSQLIERRMMVELAAVDHDARDVWRRIRFVLDQARAWSDAGGHSLRAYLDWVRLQGEDGRFVAETVLPETDHDAVRVMTIHAAKGLEFPITVVSGLTTKPVANRGRRVVWPADTWTLTEANDPVYQEFQPIDESMSDAERRRLLYVAVTRACDHLIVSVHRHKKIANTAAWTLATTLDGANHRTFVDTEFHHIAQPPTAVELPWADEQLWDQTRRQALTHAGRSTVLGATALAAEFAADPALAKGPVDLDVPPWQRGRYGTAVGRAVHGVLQFADLRTGHDIEALAAAQAAAEGVLGFESTIATLARSALASPTVSDAVQRPHWRELFVATSFSGTVVEGFIDLLIRDSEGKLIVVDYKTDQISDDGLLAERIARYGRQLAAYGLCLQALLGEPIHGGVLVMCSTNGPARDHRIEGWPDLLTEVHRQLGDRLPATQLIE